MRVEMNAIAHAFPAGHRVRLYLSTSYWPLAWPPPRPVRLHVYTVNSRLLLPERPPQASDALLREFDEAVGARPPGVTPVAAAHDNWLVHRDLALDKSMLEVINDRGAHRLDDINLVVKSKSVEKYSSVGDDFESPRAEVVWERSLRRDQWQIRTVTRTILTSTPQIFRVHANIDAYELFPEGQRRVFCRDWDAEIPRDLVWTPGPIPAVKGRASADALPWAR